MTLLSDLSLVRSIADRIFVIQNGMVVEQSPANKVMRQPKHEYTRYVIGCRPCSSKEPVKAHSPELLSVKNLNVS
jgi:microcin C transport system ATP-binding protein